MRPPGFIISELRPLPLALMLGLAAVAMIAVATPVSAQSRSIDQERLAALFAEHEFTPGEEFKALVMRIDEADDGAITQHYFDYMGTGDDRDDWWPASSVKIFAAVAAIERLHEIGFPISAWLTFEYEDGPVTLRMDDIIRHTLEHSSNAAFDRLVEFVGFDWINTQFFVPDNGFDNTVFLRGYAGRQLDPETRRGLNRNSPRIVVRRGSHRRVIAAREGQGTYSCPNQGNCTTLLELAEVMSRIMLHEQLPRELRYELNAEDLSVIRASMAVARNRQIADLVAAEFGDVPVRVYHKPGFAYRWVTDVLFVHRTDTGERWTVALCARPGRRSLDRAASTIGAILAAGELQGE